MSSNRPNTDLTCYDLCLEFEEALASYDVALLNLAAASGLPGTESLDVPLYLEKLDDWAERVKHETLRHMYRFAPKSKRPPSEFDYGNSLGRFCCYILLQVLQEDCGVAYNPDRKFDPNFGDPADLFIHGVLDENGNGGTCATIPVVYVAVARRLGYPVHLVETKGHLFFRWDDPQGTVIRWDIANTQFQIPPDRFNVEGAGEGIGYFDDSHYIQWPTLWKESDFAHGRYLRSKTLKESFAGFLVLRGECFWEYKNWAETLKAYHHARRLVPEDQRYEHLHAKRTREYEQYCKDEHERIYEINERNRRAHEERQQQASLLVKPQVVKIANGTRRPPNLPNGAVVQYVPPEQADWILPIGRPLKIAVGQPRPAFLPPGTPVQYVAPHLADPLPSADGQQKPLYLESPTRPNAFQAHQQRLKQIQANNNRLIDEHSNNRNIRPSE